MLYLLKFNNIIKKKPKKTYIISLIIFNYYITCLNIISFFLPSIKNEKIEHVLLLDFKNLKILFTLINLSNNHILLTTSSAIILKSLNIKNKGEKKINRNLLIITNYLKKNIIDKWGINNIVLLIKISWAAKDILSAFLKYIAGEQLQYILISKKISFSFQAYKKIRSIRRRLRKKLVKYSKID